MKDNWQVSFLGEIGNFTNGINKDKNSFGKGTPFVNLMDVFNAQIITEIPLGLVQVSNDEQMRYSLEIGDILFIRSSVKLEGVGKVCVVGKSLGNTIYSGFIIRFRQKSEIFDKVFASYYLNSERIRTQVISKGTLSANSNINQESLKTIKIEIPPLPQQQKIAKILNTVDTVIEKTEAAIAKYKAIKQGMMHDLFTRGIDTNTGKLRPSYQEAPELYKDSKLGMIPKEWEVSAIGKFSFITKLAGFEYTNFFDYSVGGEIIAIRALNLKKGKLNLNEIHTIPRNTSLLLPRSQLKIGDLVISYVGTVGEVAVIPENDKYHLAPNVAKISVERKEYLPHFLNEYLASSFGQKEIFRWAGSTTQAALSMSSLRQIEIIKPTLDEQISIFNSLDSINQKLQTEESTLSKYKQIKAGLMADLLTGRVGVSV